MTENAYARQANVDVEAGYEVVERIKKHVARTERLGVLGGLGSFGGMFDLSKFAVQEPVLISGADGVGTKLLLAIQADRHNTIGIDAVAMCVNDIVANGAEPLYFLDYIATGKNKPAQIEQIVAGVAQGCVQAGVALIGGETAEMPDMYAENEYDLAGFAVGLAEKKQLIDGKKTVLAGDVLLGLPSSGLHSNGYSLVRKIFTDLDLNVTLPDLGRPLIDELLEPTKLYVKELLPLIHAQKLHGLAHITGGGFHENIARILNDDLTAEINEGTWPILPIFKVLEQYGAIAHQEMYEIFNMGIGMVLVVPASEAAQIKAQLGAFEIGKVITRQNQPVIVNEHD
ncbi:phosphoribosylformylglycinamidine cyclo-ligase [Weissella oryzae SG25]|uniref:Phosphoribosylformylglycinamidine cyclo-ligase n=1 Tax=Weissella oryzae (strain DSM 25784 / JCM 18191 / LMG 30913 / SG25) TaxID=1329250 RepID=A0A069CUF7_WEIOS|nr:phosphoribosylformylglycinamidine cyclo-ligase [Weissella oryzae]GAK31124.1 phosphoribosylformylglycinamidine cyclo-ligase [Weissella oryzae SG25]